MTQQQLFSLAPEVVGFQAVFEPGNGWRVRCCMRRQGQPWSDAYEAHYDHLSTSELADVMCCEISTLLGLT